jgi:hypothetical protein
MRISRRTWLAAWTGAALGFQRSRQSTFTWKARLSGQAAPPEARLKLWYRQPAAQWDEALPVGNGRLGAMVFGGIELERLQLNEETIWAGGPRDPNNPAALKALPEVRRLLFEGRELEATQLAEKTMLGIPPAQMVSSLSWSRSSSMPPNTIAPSRPLPTGSASAHCAAGCRYQSFRRASGGAA